VSLGEGREGVASQVKPIEPQMREPALFGNFPVNTEIVPVGTLQSMLDDPSKDRELHHQAPRASNGGCWVKSMTTGSLLPRLGL
jgi:hypothetical protein